jgi:type IV secretion system protein VirD4
MAKLLDIVHGVDWNDFVSYLQARVDMPTLARAGKALAQPLPAETRATILRTAQGKLSAWMGDLVERATARSDWQPVDFRSGANPTLYICINFGDMETMRSVLRTIIGQHINLLTTGEPPARVHPPAPPILFVLDEMPQLKNMPPIANALVVGAGYGVKLWMFVQDVGQLKKEYPNAEGMMGNCAVRMYMNPDLADGTAQKLSDDIGFRESIVDGSRVKSWSRMCSRASNSRTRSSSGRAAWRVRPACRRISPISMKR